MLDNRGNFQLKDLQKMKLGKLQNKTQTPKIDMSSHLGKFLGFMFSLDSKHIFIDIYFCYHVL